MQESLADDIEGLSSRFTYSADRIDVYTYAFQEFLDNPFLGIGSENLDYYTHAHNSILHIAVKHGFFALIFWSLLVYRSLIKGLPFLKNLDYFGIFFLIAMTQIGLHNANVLTMPARHLSWEEIKKIVDIFLITNFEGGRHERRVNKIKK